jgi:hypothetical protein
MGGKGELVLYKRIRATTKKQRNKLKTDIINIIEESFTPISIIALVEEEEEEKEQSSSKRKKKRKTKRYRGTRSR